MMRGRGTPETEYGLLKGKPPYMAPEQLAQKPLDRRTDVYGCGVVLHEMLETLLELAGVSATLEVDPARFRPTDHRIGDASRLRKATGWAPAIPLRDTLAEMLDFWRAKAAG